ncbi:Uncharacterised protein [Raoultella terrigena]|uniref:Uncharacterized protein n=1 Tax=Raoultella terrigena TaxID=577 RepID=A0A3P8K5H8_RAOTE|nr:Uncharacterised protein [Raoultella terrigena]
MDSAGLRLADARCVTDHHKRARPLVAGGQLVIKEPQYGLIVVAEYPIPVRVSVLSCPFTPK